MDGVLKLDEIKFIHIENNNCSGGEGGGGEVCPLKEEILI